MKVICEQCKHEFEPVKPSSWMQALLKPRGMFDSAPELRESEKATCPNCSHVNSVVSYRFFGFLSANGMRILFAAILVVIFGFALWLRATM